MNAWLATHFFNPTLVIAGASLVAVPIVIHLINRMRFRRVRFAAMEFLLQSQQRNRRRLLLEQMLLLLARMAMVFLIMLLIARLILDPEQLSLFRGAKAHHVVLLDDSGSMRERWGETTAYKEAIGVINQLLSEGALRPDTQTFSLMLLSRPEQPFVSQRDVNDAFVLEMRSKLEPDIFQPTHQGLDLLGGLRQAKQFLSEENGTVQHLHVLSDYRERDWKDQKAIAGAIGELTSAGVTVNLVKTVPQRQANLAVTELSGAVQIAAAGVPLRLKVGVTNYSEQAVKDVRVALSDDGVKLPVSAVFDKIDPNETAFHEVDIRLITPQVHRLAATLDADVLAEDNQRYLAVDVTSTIPVLILDGDPESDAASYLADALAADPVTTGVAITLDNADSLRRRSLDEFRVIYLLNVPQVAADAIAPLEAYVRAGGGLVWFVGDLVRPVHYNEALYKDGNGLFPVPLALNAADLLADPTSTEADLVPSSHPLFAVLTGDDNPFLTGVHVQRYFPPLEDWVRDDARRGDATRTLAALRNRAPLVVEREFGSGRVVAGLSTANPLWNDWARNPSYVVFQLDLLKYIARRDRGLPLRTVGEPIQVALDPSLYTEQVEITAPLVEGARTSRLQAAPETKPPAGDETGDAELRLVATFRDTDEPGIYQVRLLNQAQQAEERVLAYNAPVSESDLDLASTENLRKRLTDAGEVRIQEPGQFQWLQGEEAGSEIRAWLLWALLGLFLFEQWFAYRLSYHPPPKKAPLAGLSPMKA